jgi:hypothetical protein
MLSSRATRGVRRSMGRAHGVRIDAGAEAVLVAENVGEDDGGLAKVHDGEAIRLEARAEVGPVYDRGEVFQKDETRVPAEGAEGLAVERVAQAGLRHGQHRHQGFVDAGIDLLSARGSATAADQEDHQRPEAQRDADESRQVAQEPQGEAATVHGQGVYGRFWPYRF